MAPKKKKVEAEAEVEETKNPATDDGFEIVDETEAGTEPEPEGPPKEANPQPDSDDARILFALAEIADVVRRHRGTTRRICKAPRDRQQLKAATRIVMKVLPGFYNHLMNGR
jgi:hypothetical protein